MTSSSALVPGGRSFGSQPAKLANGWQLKRLTPPSRLFAANGLRDGRDGRLYVAQCIGSQIAALDVDTGEIETICAMGGDIVGPDDLVFDDAGSMYVTECMNARVSVIEPCGKTRVLCSDLPGANGITFHQGRLFVDECRLGGRLLEVDRETGTPRVIVADIDLPNALEVGPDGLLYYPLVGAGEIWRVHPDEGEPEMLVGGLSHPVAVKFDADGHIVCPQSGSGEVLRINRHTGSCEVIASLGPGLDNVATVDGRLFVSYHLDGRITEILRDGNSREVVAAGFQFPLDMCSDGTGRVLVSDNSSVHRIESDGTIGPVGWVFGEGFPGSVRGLASGDEGRLVATTTDSRIVEYRPDLNTSTTLYAGESQLCGVAIASDGAILAVDQERGQVIALGNSGARVIAGNLDVPMGIAVGPDGSIYVSEFGAGRIVRIGDDETVVAVDALEGPQGITFDSGRLYIVDVGLCSILSYEPSSGELVTVAANLPIGPPPGVTPKSLNGLPPLSGPLGPFAGIAAASPGNLCFSADAEGSIMILSATGSAD